MHAIRYSVYTVNYTVTFIRHIYKLFKKTVRLDAGQMLHDQLMNFNACNLNCLSFLKKQQQQKCLYTKGVM